MPVGISWGIDRVPHYCLDAPVVQLLGQGLPRDAFEFTACRAPAPPRFKTRRDALIKVFAWIFQYHRTRPQPTLA